MRDAFDKMNCAIDAIDKLNNARDLFEAALMAVSGIRDERQRDGLGALLNVALGEMHDGIDLIDLPQMERMVGGAA